MLLTVQEILSLRTDEELDQYLWRKEFERRARLFEDDDSKQRRPSEQMLKRCYKRCSRGEHLWSDPGLRSTPQLWRCEHCGTVTRWVILPQATFYAGIAPPARDYRPDRLIHSRVTHANRKRAMTNLPPDIERIVHRNAKLGGVDADVNAALFDLPERADSDHEEHAEPDAEDPFIAEVLRRLGGDQADGQA
jgi:hypothetical protein